MQPTHSSPQVCPLKPELQYTAPAHTSRWVSQAGRCREVARTFVLVSLSILPATRHLLHASLSLWSSLYVLAELPTSEWSSQGKGTFPLLELPPRVPCPIWFLFSLFDFDPTQLHDDLSCNFSFDFMRFSASIQQIFYENFSPWRGIFDVFVGGGEFQVLLFHYLHESSVRYFSISLLFSVFTHYSVPNSMACISRFTYICALLQYLVCIS